MQERKIESLSCLYFSLGYLTSAALVLQLFPIPSCPKTKIMASSPITSWQINGETVETVVDFIFLGSKITVDGDAAMKLKDGCSLEGKL